MNLTSTAAIGLGLLIASGTAAFAADVESLPAYGAESQGVAKQCLKDLAAFDQKLAEFGFDTLPPGSYPDSTMSGYYAWGGATPRQKIDTLHDAAYVYGMSGDEQSCQVVLSSMEKVFDDHQKLVGIESDSPDVRHSWRLAHLSRAKPVAQMDHLMRADVLIGSEIRNPEDKKLGKIEDVVLNPAKKDVAYVLASRGGFLGMGGHLVAVPWSDLLATDDHELYVLDVSEEAFEGAPEVHRGNFGLTADPDWRRSLDAYWDKALGK